MTPQRWQQVKSLLAEALDRPPGERSGFLDECCGTDAELRHELESLMVHADDRTADARKATYPSSEFHQGSGRIGTLIGPYRLEKLLGEGGMGAVYLAHREVDGYSMRVALKIMRVAALSDYSLRRFRMERQILARLTHPNITRLIDGGVTEEGLPYLVTEFVDGTPLDRWCVEAKPLLPARLRVFLDVCQALAFAHRNLIVHGDIKPANILVTPDGSAKLVDFGIARLIDPEAVGPAATTTLALTPAWASPEQLRGEPPTVPSDLYSLGRVLYEMISGRPAYRFEDLPPHRYLDVLASAAQPPSAACGDRTLAGDLDKIALKAVDFDPEHRYQSADQFAEDIRCYLDSRPVSARTKTWTYRAVKFVRRNRASVFAGIAAGVLLVAMLVITIWQARTARESYAIAARQAQAVRKLANSFIFELDDAVAEMPGATKVRAQIMHNAVDYLDRVAKESWADVELQQELALAYMKVGDIMGRAGVSNLGKSAEAMEDYRKAEKILEALASRPEATSDQKFHLAVLYSRRAALENVMGSFSSALNHDEKALSLRRGLLEASPNDVELRRAVAQSLTALGSTYSQLGQWPKVLDTRRQALKVYEQLVAANPKSLTDRRGLVLARARLGSILSYQRQHSAALDQLRRAVNEQKALLDQNPANSQITMAFATTLSAYARGLEESGDLSSAISRYENALAIYESLAATDAADIRSRSLRAATRAAIGRLTVRSGWPSAGLPYLEAALRERIELSKNDPLNSGALGEVAYAHSFLGEAHERLGHRATARRAYATAKEILDGMVTKGQANAADKLLLGRVEVELSRLRM